jgi:hypothetical protein
MTTIEWHKARSSPAGEQAKPVPAAKLRELRIGGKVSAWWTLRKH